MDDTEEEIFSYLYDKRRTRETVDAGSRLGLSDTIELDRGIVNLVESLNNHGFETKVSCSGLLSEHYPIQETKNRFDETHVLDALSRLHVRPFVKTNPRYHTIDANLRVDEEFYDFVNECLLESNFSIHTKNIGASNDYSMSYMLYREVSETSNHCSSIEEFDKTLTRDINCLVTEIEEFYTERVTS